MIHPYCLQSLSIDNVVVAKVSVDFWTITSLALLFIIFLLLFVVGASYDTMNLGFDLSL